MRASLLRKNHASTGGRLVAVGDLGDLVSYAHGLRHTDSKAALAAAKRAVALVELRAGGGPRSADLRCQAYAVLGNSLRISGALPAAQRALEKAERWRRDGSRAAGIEVMSLHFRASLSLARRMFLEADSLLVRAEEITTNQGDRNGYRKSRIKRAIVATYRGDPAEGAALILGVLDGEPDWPEDLRLSALETLMSGFALAGEARRALEVWVLSSSLFVACGDLIQLKLRWVRGLVACQLFDQVQPLLGVQAEYLARGLGYMAALVSLDLAAHHAQAQRTESVAAHLAEAEPVLRAYGVAIGDPCADTLRLLRLTLSAASCARPSTEAWRSSSLH